MTTQKYLDIQKGAYFKIFPRQKETYSILYMT